MRFSKRHCMNVMSSTFPFPTVTVGWRVFAPYQCKMFKPLPFKTICPGKYCDQEGLEDVAGDCTAGYYCPTGSISDKSKICPLGAYCVEGSSLPTNCTKGKIPFCGVLSFLLKLYSDIWLYQFVLDHFGQRIRKYRPSKNIMNGQS